MQAISELELELKRGKTKELFRLARVLGRTVPLRIEVKSKAERGYALLKGGGLQVEKAAEIDIPPNMSAEEAFRAIARSCVRQLVANEPILLAGRAEGLHQLRIGLRRLRASIAIFADVVGDEHEKTIKAELKWITRELGPARDLDVFAADVLDPLRASHPSDAGLTMTQRNFDAKRKEAYRQAATAVRSDRFRAAVLDLVAWVETGDWRSAGGEHRKANRARAVAEHAKVELSKLRKRIKRKGSDIRHLSVMQRHRLRIRAKRLRYATEFFAGTFPGEASARRRQESLAALKDVQDALGGLNDLATRHALIADGLAVDAEQAECAAAQGGLAAPDSEETLLRKAEQAFTRFAAIDPFWKA
jgi:inorganic triphosphatase YgiF